MNKLSTCLLISLSFQAYATDAEIKLSEVTWFSLGYQGFAGKKSSGEYYYQEIARLGKKSEATFKKILTSNKATNESKLYAACGLWRIDRKWLNAFKPHHGSVTVLQGDILRKEEFGVMFLKIKEHGCDI